MTDFPFTGINKPIVRNPVRYATGLTATWASNTTLTLRAGACSDLENNIDMVVESDITINAAITGKNGLDTGSLGARTFCYVYGISDSTSTNAPAALISASASAPVMPYGYDSKQLLDIKVTDGSGHFVPTLTEDMGLTRKFIYLNPASVTISTTASFVAVSLAAAVPPLAMSEVLFAASVTPTAAENYLALSIDGTNIYAKLSGVVAGKLQAADLACYSLFAAGTGVSTIYTKVDAGTGTCLVKSFTFDI